MDNNTRHPDGTEQLLNQILSDQEELRANLARELHSELGALLTGMSLDLSGLRASSGQSSVELDAALDSIRALLREAVILKRHFIERLYPSTLTLLGLSPAVESLARRFGEDYGLAVEAAVADLEMRVGSGLGIDMYRVAEAALENVVRHASAHTIQVVLSEADNWLVLVIRDDGAGFDVATLGPGSRGPGSLGQGSGFRLMRHRLGRWQGELQLKSSPGNGATVTARAPLVAVGAS